MPTRALRQSLLALTLLMSGGQVQALTCSASVPTLAFGSYSGTLGLATDSQTTLTVTCSSLVSILVSYTISLSSGNSGNASARELRQSGHALQYNLYSDALRTVVWGSGASAVSDSFLLSILGIGVDRLYPIYGRIPGGQTNVSAGSYSDNITVTVAY